MRGACLHTVQTANTSTSNYDVQEEQLLLAFVGLSV